LSLVLSGSNGTSSSSSNAYSQSTTTSTPRMFVLGSEDKSAGVEIGLRAVHQDAQITQIKTFDITIDNVVQAKQGGSITADSSDPSLKIVKAKVRTDTAVENLRELPRTQGNTFSLRGLASGVYILDIIAQKDNRDLAYETIMVILDPGKTTITANLQIINNIITKVKNNVRTEVVFRDENGDSSGGSGDGGGGGSSGDGNGCSNEPGSAGMGFPYQKATQCQKLEFDQCERTGENSARCDTAEERFSDDCEGFSNQQECDAHFSVPLNPIVPIAPLPDCSDVPAGTACSKEEGTTEPVLPADTGCLNAGQTEGEDECIEDTPENRAELARQAAEEPTQPLTEEPTVPQFGMEDLDPDQPGLQQDDGDIAEDQIVEDSNDIGGTDTGSSEDTDTGSSEDTDTDTSDGDDVGNSGSSDGDDNGGDDNGGGGDGGDADDEGGGG
jgi:hypothetical protein